ncbi:3'-5'-exoribonuclease family protein [Klebsormidium nitens]|uniref:Ribosomal RNA-processing protein 42 n=1 Tax=Klebsormidium nitens TaxID=105231 RepID=A0A1Y1I1Z2_KLENI|nr:3'-5'-exoribonuclease family protein [Klebsormidium nitens]|eukprot:GAQ84934.1 3'-5'-exoribonuclease family protein [Klebsormidium nitens]
MPGLSAAELSFLEGGIAQDLRNDGRGREDFRSFSIQLDVISQASGSARVRLGATDILASIKAELGSPPAEFPHLGRLELAVEISPTAGPEFEGRGGEELSAELGKALERSFAGGANGTGAAVDLAALSVVEGKTCWVLYADVLVLNADGNILDASAIGIKAALSNTRIPKVEVLAGEGDEEGELELNDDPDECARVSTAAVPLIVTLTKVGRHYIADATGDEEAQMSSALSVAVNEKGQLCGVTKRGSAGIDPSVISDMLSVARRIGKRLLAKVDAEISLAESRLESET